MKPQKRITIAIIRNTLFMDENVEKPSFMLKVATFVVDRRNLFFLLFAIVIAFSVISSGWGGESCRQRADGHSGDA